MRKSGQSVGTRPQQAPGFVADLRNSAACLTKEGRELSQQICRFNCAAEFELTSGEMDCPLRNFLSCGQRPWAAVGRKLLIIVWRQSRQMISHDLNDCAHGVGYPNK